MVLRLLRESSPMNHEATRAAIWKPVRISRRALFLLMHFHPGSREEIVREQMGIDPSTPQPDPEAFFAGRTPRPVPRSEPTSTAGRPPIPRPSISSVPPRLIRGVACVVYEDLQASCRGRTRSCDAASGRGVVESAFSSPVERLS